MKLDMSDLANGMTKFKSKADTAVEMFANTAAKTMETDAKEQARWTDRTGRARQTLVGYVTQENSHTTRINLAHGVDYGIWLELANEKRFAIVEPIVRLSSPYILRDFEGMIDKMKLR